MEGTYRRLTWILAIGLPLIFLAVLATTEARAEALGDETPVYRFWHWASMELRANWSWPFFHRIS